MAAERAKIYEEQMKITKEKDQQFNNMFSIPKLGWFNCDAYRTSELAQIVINDENTNNTDIDIQYKIILKKRKTVMSYAATERRTWTSFIPPNELFTLVALKVYGGEPFMAIEENTAKNNLEIKLNFKQMSATEIKEKLKMLDN